MKIVIFKNVCFCMYFVCICKCPSFLAPFTLKTLRSALVQRMLMANTSVNNIPELSQQLTHEWPNDELTSKLQYTPHPHFHCSNLKSKKFCFFVLFCVLSRSFRMSLDFWLIVVGKMGWGKHREKKTYFCINSVSARGRPYPCHIYAHVPASRRPKSQESILLGSAGRLTIIGGLWAGGWCVNFVYVFIKTRTPSRRKHFICHLSSIAEPAVLL